MSSIDPDKTASDLAVKIWCPFPTKYGVNNKTSAPTGISPTFSNSSAKLFSGANVSRNQFKLCPAAKLYRAYIVPQDRWFLGLDAPMLYFTTMEKTIGAQTKILSDKLENEIDISTFKYNEVCLQPAIIYIA